MSDWIQAASTRLLEREQQHLRRHRLVLDSSQGAEIVVDGQVLLNFSSNDYLGLAAEPALVKAFTRAAERYGVGSGSSHMVSGHQKIHQQCEEAFARFLGRDRVLMFSSGYMANLAVLNTFLDRSAAVFQDRLNHASLIDGGLASRARMYRYQHVDVTQLQQLLQNKDASMRMIATDGVFSMDGDLAPLDQIAALADQHSAALMVDDAHGIGVLGDSGAGIAEHFHLDQQQLPLLMGTLGKAFGVSGAFVAGSETVIESLLQLARTYIYTTAAPAACSAAALAALDIVQCEPQRRNRLNHLISYFRNGFSQLALAENCDCELMPSITAIQPILLGSSQRALAVGAELRKRGILVGVIRPPTVPAGSARLRISLSALHSSSQVDRLLDAMAAALSHHGLPDHEKATQASRIDTNGD